MKKVLPLIIVLIFSSCEIGKQKKDFEILVECEFRLSEINTLQLAGVPVENIIKSDEIDFSQFPNLVMGLMTEDMPIVADIVLSVYNPSMDDVELSAFDYVISIDEVQIAEGKMTERTTLLPQSETLVPIFVKGNAYRAFSANQKKWIDVLSGKSKESIVVQIKVKPNIDIVGTEVKMPGYLTFEKNIDLELLKQYL